MPERLAYDEAMLFSAIRLKLQDPELKQGKVETTTTKTALGSVERPWGIEGGFAVVYKFRTRSGKVRALRCFRVPMSQDMQFRYERIGTYFSIHARDITVDFKYHDAAILVKEQGKAQNQAYPVIDMDWIEGLTLLDKVDEACRKRDRATLRQIGRQWLYLLAIMRQSKIAHGDLAAVNIMVKPDGQLILVDYDGVYIPEFAGMTKVLLGQADYQHPQMAQRRFDERMDDFSALVVYTALLALEVQPELWVRYAQRDSQGKLLDTNLLFTQQDFKEPLKSPLLRELEQLGNKQVAAAVKELKHACQQPIDQIQFPIQLIDPDYETRLALGRLEKMIKLEDDVHIVDSWVPKLETYAQAQRYRGRVELAQQRVAALQRFRVALRQQSIPQIIASYDPQLDASRSVTQRERQILSFARSFAQTEKENEDALLNILDAMQKANMLNSFAFTPQEQQAITRARQRMAALQQLKVALQSKSIERIATAYDTLRDPAKGLSTKEHEMAELASAFIKALDAEDDEAIASAYESIDNFSYLSNFLFTIQQQQRAKLALQRRAALARFRIALTSKRPKQVVTSYNTILDGCKNVTQEERDQFSLARAFVQAFEADDDDALVVAYDAIHQSPYRTAFVFTTQEQQRVTEAQIQREALLTFHIALRSKRPHEIAAAYNEVLDHNKRVTQGEREVWSLARAFIQAFEADDDDALVAVDTPLQQHPVFDLTVQEQQRLLLACRRQAAFETFWQVIASLTKNAHQIVASYDPSLLDTSDRVTPEQRARVAAARDYLAMYRAVQKGIIEDNDAAIRTAYNEVLAERFTDFSLDEQKRIEKAILSEALEEALLERRYGDAIQLALSIQTTTGQPMRAIVAFKLQKAVLRFVREHDLTNLSLHIEERADGNYAIVRWQWPEDELIQNALIVWQASVWPPRVHNYARLNSGGRHIWVERKNQEREAQCEILIHTETDLYIQGYTAMLDHWDKQQRWRFSDGIEPTSQAQLHIPSIVAQPM